MAILQQPESGGSSYNLFREEIKDDIATEGQFVAKCIDVRDAFGVTRRKFQSEETETVDLTAFLFQFNDDDGNGNMIATDPMKISGHEKSTLFQFIKSWMGKPAPYGFDTANLKDHHALITVEHVPSKKTPGKVYPKISNIAPVPKAMMAFIKPDEAPAPQPTSKPAKGKAAGRVADEVPF